MAHQCKLVSNYWHKVQILSRWTPASKPRLLLFIRYPMIYHGVLRALKYPNVQGSFFLSTGTSCQFSFTLFLLCTGNLNHFSPSFTCLCCSIVAGRSGRSWFSRVAVSTCPYLCFSVFAEFRRSAFRYITLTSSYIFYTFDLLLKYSMHTGKYTNRIWLKHSLCI